MALSIRAGLGLSWHGWMKSACYASVLLSPPTLQAQQGDLEVGYAAVGLGAFQGGVPYGTALFTFRDGNGILVSQAGVAGVLPVAAGRVFVDQLGTRTGIAFVNTGQNARELHFTLRNSDGSLTSQQSRTFDPGEHLALFVDELFPNLPAGYFGTLEFADSQGEPHWAAVTLRQGANAQNQPIFTTLPVVAPDRSAGMPDALVFPQVGGGDGLSTQIFLLNLESQPVTGRIRLTDGQGTPLAMESLGVTAAEFPYQLPANGALRMELTRSDNSVGVGYAEVLAVQGKLPAGSAVFRFTEGSGVISEAGVGEAALTEGIRMFVDNAGTRTGVAIANWGTPEQEFEFRLYDRNWSEIERRSRTIKENGHLAIFVDEIFPDLPFGFTGILEVHAGSPFSGVTLKLTVNEAGRPILTTLPIIDTALSSGDEPLYFPQVGFGFGFSTRLILIKGTEDVDSAGSLNFFNSNGAPLTLPISGIETSRVEYQVTSGGALQFYPGVTSRQAEILVDPANLTVNQGNSVSLRPILLDESGNPRDDFPIAFESLNPNTVEVDSKGTIKALNRGFATILISSGSLLRSFTVTAGTVTSNTPGFQPRGVAQDFSGRIYLANGQDHSLLATDAVETAPTLFAGTPPTPGLRNGERLSARFSGPTFLAINQGSAGELFVSDTENHVIRKVSPGSGGEVSTLAGTGQPGNSNGASFQASFNNPRGIALDDHGFLWVADSGNHTIRRVNLSNGQVTTVAGSSGNPGLADGTGTQARFSAPSGIVYEAETLVQQLIREQTGAPPPPASILVADFGNGVIRRVFEDGRVQTLRKTASSLPSSRTSGFRQGTQNPAQTAPALTFSEPLGLARDPFGNVYVSESGTGLVKALLWTGETVLAAQRGTFANPGGMAITIRGRILVPDSTRTLQQIRYAGPTIGGVFPPEISGKQGQTIALAGQNFAPDSLVIIGNVPITDIDFQDSTSLSFRTPELPSGTQTLTLVHRGGLAQASVKILPPAVGDLAPGEITTVAGGSTFEGDGNLATAARLSAPQGAAISNSGDLLVADTSHHRIRQVNAVSGIIRTVAGTGRPGGGPVNSLGLLADLDSPASVIFDAEGRLLIADTANHRILSLDPSNGHIGIVAGRGVPGFSGNGGPAENATLNGPRGLVLSPGGRIQFADSGNHRIREIDASTGTIQTIAGTGQAGFSGDNGPATSAELNFPTSLTNSQDGSIWIADSENHRIRRILPDGTIETAVGTGEAGFSGDEGPATASRLNRPTGVAINPESVLFVADSANHRVRAVRQGVISTFAGTGLPGFSGDSGAAVSASLDNPSGLVFDAAGSLFVVDSGNSRIRLVDPRSLTIRTVAGSSLDFGGDGDDATVASLAAPGGLAFGNQGLVVAETAGHRIRLIDWPALEPQSISTLVGTGRAGDSGEEPDPLEASLSRPASVALAPDSLLVVDTGNHRIRRLREGSLSLLAGTGEAGFLDDIPSQLSRLNTPSSVAVDFDGGFLIADTENHLVRKIDMSGFINTLAGTGTPGFSGEGDRPFLAQLSGPTGIAVASDGTVFISDSGNHRIRGIDPSRQAIYTVAGTGSPGYSGDGGPALASDLRAPAGLVLHKGFLYLADTGNHVVRAIDLSTGTIRTIAGTGNPGISGDGGAAEAAALRFPWGVTFSPAGDLLISDQGNGRIRLVKQLAP